MSGTAKHAKDAKKEAGPTLAFFVTFAVEPSFIRRPGGEP